MVEDEARQKSPVGGPECLRHVLTLIEAHTFTDLQSMVEITHPAGQETGAAGYPITATVMAAMELLGGIVRNVEFSFRPRQSMPNFGHYWDCYLSRVNDLYAVDGLADLLWQLLRHGVAHMSVSKGGVVVAKRGGDLYPHLSVRHQCVVVDCVQFAEDFRLSYAEHLLPALAADADLRQNAERNAARFVGLSSDAAEAHRDTIQQLEGHSHGH